MYGGVTLWGFRRAALQACFSTERNLDLNPGLREMSALKDFFMITIKRDVFDLSVLTRLKLLTQQTTDVEISQTVDFCFKCNTTGKQLEASTSHKCV